MKIPQLGIGTFMLSPKEAEASVLSALETGYRHVDTANVYLNERAVGRAIKKSGLPREEIFLVTKIFPNHYACAAEQIDATLRMLDVDYVDLMLLHQPFGEVDTAWKACEQAVRDGKVKGIGVCNFIEEDMEKLLSYATIKPALIQNECHPYFAQNDMMLKYGADGIPIEAWYPLGHGDSGLMGEQIFTELSGKYGKSIVQIILRWHIQCGHIIIPGSKNPDHIRSNMEIFDFALSDEEMARIGELDGKKRFFKFTREQVKSGLSRFEFDYDSQE